MGGIELDGPDGPAERLLAQPLRVGLFAWLALAEPRGRHQRDRILPLFWPEADERRARNSLSQALYHLRHELTPGLLPGRGADRVGLDLTLLDCDVYRLEAAAAANDWAAVRRLHRGELLPGLHVAGAPAFEHWLALERERVRAVAVEAGWRAAVGFEQAGDQAAALDAARWAAEVVPFDEEALRRVMGVQLRMGDRAGAVAALERFAQRLRTEFDESPSAETVALLAGHEAVALPEAPAPRAPIAVGDEPPPPTGETPASDAARPGRRTLVAAGVAAMLALVAAVVWARHPAAPVDPVVAVLPFATHGDPALGYVGDGLTSLLEGKLDHAGGLRVADPRAVRALVRQAAGTGDSEAPLRAASRVQATWLVTGDVTAVGEGVQVRAELRRTDAPGRVLAASTVTGRRDDLFLLADSLALELLGEGLGLGRRDLLAAARVATASLPAFRAFLDGEAAMRAGSYAEAAERFRAAVALDSGFAIAAYRAGVALDWAGYTAGDVQAMLAQAGRGRDRLSEHQQRLLDAATAHYAQDLDRAEEVLRALVADHPNDVEAWYRLGETLFHLGPPRGRSWREAREPFERALALDPADPEVAVHLARLAAADGDRARLEALTAVALPALGGSVRAWELRALLAYTDPDAAASGDFERALAQAPPGSAAEAARTVAVFLEDPRTAERLAQLGPSARDLPRPTEFAAAQGHWDAVWRLMDRDCALQRNVCPLRRLWLASLPGVALTEAQAVAFRQAVEQLPASSLGAGTSEQWARQVQQLSLGWFAVARGDSARMASALDTLAAVAREMPATASRVRAYSTLMRAAWRARRGGAVRAADSVAAIMHDADLRRITLGSDAAWPVRFMAAELLAAGGRDEDAFALYRSVPDASARDLMFLPYARLGEARILARRGDPLARARYAHVLDLWADPDPSFRGFVDAVRREAGAPR